jgi:hypothetical protein
MAQISKKLRNWKGDGREGYQFWCPGCKTPHSVQTSEGGWGFDGNVDLPTFTPSILVQTGHHIPTHADNVCWCTYNKKNPDNPAPFTCRVCHSFVTNGRIQFCHDSTHELAGQTVDLPDWPTRYEHEDTAAD